MGDVCRYLYRGRFCAHRMVEGRECIGEGRCTMKHMTNSPFRRNSDCSMEQWQGLYCSRYQRFFCAGRGNCETMEDYMGEFARFRESREMR